MKFQRTYDERPADLDFGSTVLIVDDEEGSRGRLALLCAETPEGSSLRILQAASTSEAMGILSSTCVHVILLDKNLGPDASHPEQNGIGSIPRFLQIQAHAQILVITSSRDTQDAAQAISAGALWFLPKDTDDDLIVLQIKRAVHVANLELQRVRDKAVQATSGKSIDLAGHSFAVTKLRAQLHAVAETNRPVLLTGPTGCGKTTAAKLINEHRKQYLKQPGRSFLSLNMGAISSSLAERELFGNEKGAYTGADYAKPGFFELSNNGTLFLDEIGEAPLDLQVKLLKVIEEGEFVRLGGQTTRKTSFKLICATNRDLDAMIERGEFREDLYMRISTFVVSVPGLGERGQDIPDIIRSLLPKCCEDSNVYVTFEDLPADFVEYLVTTPQRGNIRGIEHQLSRLLVYAKRDKRGQPQLVSWRDIPGMAGRRPTTLAGNRAPLTLNEFMARPLDMVGADFPGLIDFVTTVSDRITCEALAKHPKLIDAAVALKVSVSKVSLDRKRINQQEGGRRKVESGAKSAKVVEEPLA